MKKTAIVTGAGRGIGAAIAKRLAKDGYNLVLVSSSDEERYADFIAEIAEITECIYVKADISVSEDRKRIVASAVERFGEIHVLVNNAGVAPKVRLDLLEMTEESYDRVMGINAKGTLFLTQLAANQMITQPIHGKKRGVIINISSCSAEVSSINRGEYCVSKAGLAMVTTLFADRLAAEGIFVNEVRPGVIATDMTAKVKERYDELFAEGISPIARWGTPEDIAGAVGALCSDDFLYTTGSHIYVDGGLHIKRL